MDGSNHFYEFYQFPVRASGTQNLYNDNNRRMNESFTLSNQLHYFSKTGYLVTVTSEEENDIITEKAIGNGWLGGIAQTNNQNSNANLNECGGIRQRVKTGTSSNDVSGRYLATKDFQALRKLEDSNVWKWYKGGEDYSGTKSDPQYIRDLEEIYSNSQVKTISGISATDGDTPTIVTTSSSHGLKDDDIIRLTDINTSDAGGDDIDGTTLNKYYRVVFLTNQTFQLVQLDSRLHVDTSGISYTSSSARLRELEGIRNEFYRTTSAITNVNNNPQNQANLEMFWKDPKVAYGNIQGEQSENDACSVWRWVTGPEQFIYDNRGLAFAPNRRHNDNPSASQTSSNANWNRTAPSGQQIGEKFKDGMPFRYWGPGEPNNYQKREPGLHMLGTHFSSDKELRWNDLYNWNANHSNAYGIRGIIVEYGGLESVGDPITRIAAKRIINLFDRRVTKATITISSGLQTGDKLTASDDISDLGLSVTGDDSEAITFTGVGTCKNYLDAIKGITFEHTGAAEGTRQISVEVGNVKKPTGSDHYYKKVDGTLTYQQADFQASYSNLCGLQGYLANVTTTADLTAISTLGITSGKEAWVNGTDVCQGGIYRSGFWRYSSGPWEDKEFWRLRINSSADIDSISACNETNVRSSQPSVRVGPFETANWVNNHPAANNNDYLTYRQSSSPGIKTRSSASSSDVEAYIIRYGGSVGDFTGTDLDEVNDINVLAGPIRAEISFYTDSSDNSIFINNEDTLKVPTTGDGALSAGWTKAQAYSSQVAPLKITPPSAELITMDDWRRELAKVYYKNINLSNFTPGNRKIKITLVYGASSLNQTIGIVKTIGSKNKVTVTPISWSNR